MRFFIILFLLPAFSLAFEPISISTGLYTLAAAGAAYFYAYDPVCEAVECCKDPYVKTSVALSFDDLYGQPLVKKLLEGIFRKRTQYLKPLSLSFHGPPGTGKTHLSNLISESLFKFGKKSKHFHFLTVGYDFPNPRSINIYKDSLRVLIHQSLMSCPNSVFVFDEFDKMPNELHDVLVPFLESRGEVGSVSTTKATFIFLSNVGSRQIVHKSNQLYADGVSRENFKLSDFENDLQKSIYNEEGSFKDSPLIKKELIDAYVPFLPLEESHVRSCIEKEYFKFHSYYPTRDAVNEILAKINFISDGRYAETGCKKVLSYVARS